MKWCVSIVDMHDQQILPDLDILISGNVYLANGDLENALFSTKRP